MTILFVSLHRYVH